MQRLLAAALLVALTASAVPVAANHVQSDSGRIIVFDHVTGNEWWVEVALSGQDAGSVVKVESMDTNGAWVTLEKKSWGPYAASFHIEPGNQVRFRASWAGGAQQVSCWFTHPAGAEQCVTPPPPPPPGWTARTIGDGQSTPAGSDMAIGDVDLDGRNEVYLTNAQGLWQFAWTSTGWVRSQVPSWHATTHVAVGDLTGDGRDELYASGPTGYDDRDDVSRYEWDGQSWSAWWLFTTDAAGTHVTDMTIGDGEGDGRADLYFTTTLPRSLLMQIEYEDLGGYESYNTRFVVPREHSMTAVAVGDPDNDGRANVVFGTSDGVVEVMTLQENQGSLGPIGSAGNAPVRAIAIGAPEGDGRNYIYASSGTQITRFAKPSTTWVATVLPSSTSWSPMDVAVGDADNIGFPELLAAGNDGHVYRYVWANGAWSARDLAATEVRGTMGLAVGDGDGDGLREIYVAGPGVSGGTSNPIVQVMDHAVPARPPAPWHEMLVGEAGGRSGESDIAIGDGDRDGKREVYVAAREGLFQFKWTGAGWQRTVLSNHLFHRVAVGDGDRDGRVDVYASGAGLNGGYEVLRFTADGSGGWASSQVHGSVVPVGTMTIGDVDDDGTSELYIAMMPEFGDETQSMPSYQLEFEGGNWQVRYLANLVGGARSSWIGDADRDGDRDWYVVGAAVHRLDITTAGAGSASLIGGDIPGEDNWYNGIAAVDGDRDGRQEVYVGFSAQDSRSEAGLLRFSVRTDGWERQKILTPFGSMPRDLAFGDGDGDGQSELYYSGFDGGLWRLTSSAGVWQHKSMADVGSEMGIDLALGDADGDGKVEAYMTAFDTSRSPPENVYRLGTVPPPVSFDATFSQVRGNEWWIQATVDAAGGTLSKVDVRLNGGAWQPLAKQSWGGWAASYHAVQGTIVQLRATSSAGATDLSSCYQWIPPSNLDAAVVACSQQPPPPGFDATFSNVKGNEWWVEAKVTANQPIARVEARVNCGPTWHALELKSWGAWAASFNVPAGSKVDFRASSNTGSDLSGGYIWPNATPTGGC